MHLIVDGAVVALFALWLVLTALGQLDVRLARRLKDWDVFMLLPSFRFFAPTPSVHDLHLLYRDRLADGYVAAWREVPLPLPPPWINPLWNPGRRERKALFDATQHLARQINERSPEPRAILLSIPYLILLNYVSGLPRLCAASTTQFLVMRSDRLQGGDPQPFFVSSLHSLEERTHAA